MNHFLTSLQDRRNKFVTTSKENDFDEGITNLLTELYPDNAHFIYELLQNAEDAEAVKVTFQLQPDQLIVTHNGKKLFTDKDVEAITNIGKGTKKDDVNKIGKFGVGFKSVFSYTQSPIIHSGEFSFQITDLVVPSEIAPINKKSEETVFIFPFNNIKKAQKVAYEEIKKGLTNINRTTLLFLSSIVEIEIVISNMSYSLTKKYDDERKVATIVNSKTNKDSNFLIFTKRLPDEEKLYVAIAFMLTQDKQTNELITNIDNQAKVSIYFPAEKETSNLKFNVHAPFASTVARDSITDRSENKFLIELIAELVCDATRWMKKKELLNDNFIRCLPIEEDNISAFFKPIQKKIVELFNTQPFLMCEDGNYHPACECWQTTNRLKSVISPEDLRILKSITDTNCFWLKRPLQKNTGTRAQHFLKGLNLNSFSENDFEGLVMTLCDNYSLESFNIKEELKSWQSNYGYIDRGLAASISDALKSNLSQRDIIINLYKYVEKNFLKSYYIRFDLERVKRVITSSYSVFVINEWLSNKSNQWLKNLYELLCDFNLSTNDEEDDDDYGDNDFSDYESLRLLIKLNTGGFNLTKHECFFPSATRIESIKNYIINSEIYDDNVEENKASKSKRFLRKVLGVKEIAIEDEVKHIVEQYQEKGKVYLKENINHIKLFLKFFSQRKAGFDKSMFQKIPFLINHENGVVSPGKILIDSPLIDTSLSKIANDEYKPLHSEYFDPRNKIDPDLFKQFLLSIGCWNTLPILKRERDYKIKIKLGRNEKVSAYEINENFYMPILEPFKNPDVEKSLVIWNEISKLTNSGLKAKYCANSKSEERTCDSDVIEILKSSAWIPDQTGRFHKPQDILMENLHVNFEYDNRNGWLTLIGLNSWENNKTEIQQTNDILIKNFGVDIDLMVNAKKSGVDINRTLQEQINKMQHINLKAAINEHTKNVTPISNSEISTVVEDEIIYQEKAQQQLYRNILNAQKQNKTYNYSKVVKFGKTDTNEFLKRQYHGLCQICGFTFRQSGNKGNYFELFDWLSERISHQRTNLIYAGSSLCLCSRCHSVLKYGDFNAEFLSTIEEIENTDYISFAEKFNFVTDSEEIPEVFKDVETAMYKLPIRKLQKDEFIFYTEEHFIHFYNVLTLNSTPKSEVNTEEIAALSNDKAKNNNNSVGIPTNPNTIGKPNPEQNQLLARKVKVGDLITLKYSTKKDPFKIRLAKSYPGKTKDDAGNSIVSEDSPFGVRIKDKPVGYTFDLGNAIVKIINID